MSLNRRNFDALLRAAGVDVDEAQPFVLDSVQPVYIVEDLRGGLPNRVTGVLHLAATPTVTAGKFCMIDMCARDGFWLKRARCLGAAAAWSLQPIPPAGFFLDTADANITGSQWFAPEGFPGISGDRSFLPNGTFMRLQQGSSSIPPSNFPVAEANGAEVTRDTALWVPPGISWIFWATTVAVPVTFRIEIVLPSVTISEA